MFWLLACSDFRITHIDDDSGKTTYIAIDTGVAVEERLDILFVVDESCSMSEEQEILEANVGTLLSPLESKAADSIDWRAGISSANPAEGGAVGWAYRDQEDPVGTLSTYIGNLNTNCQGYTCEAGFDAAIISNLKDKEHRDDADLLTVFVSDEHEQSSNSLAGFLTEASKFRGVPFTTINTAIVHSVADTSCAGVAERGSGYIEAADVFVELCDVANWPDTINAAIAHVQSINRYAYLTHEPFVYEDGSVDMRVLVDGKETDGWILLSTKVLFDQPLLPGQQWMVVYQVEDAP